MPSVPHSPAPWRKSRALPPRVAASLTMTLQAYRCPLMSIEVSYIRRGTGGSVLESCAIAENPGTIVNIRAVSATISACARFMCEGIPCRVGVGKQETDR